MGMGNIASNIHTPSIGYRGFFEAKVSFSLEEDKRKALNIIWKASVLAKIRAFGWRLFMDRLATKDQLIKTGISFAPNKVVCVLCLSEEEDLNHFFFDSNIKFSLGSNMYLDWLQG